MMAFDRERRFVEKARDAMGDVERLDEAAMSRPDMQNKKLLRPRRCVHRPIARLRVAEHKARMGGARWRLVEHARDAPHQVCVGGEPSAHSSAQGENGGHAHVNLTRR